MNSFGDIVEPVSRTVWEDWDDVPSELVDSELQWQNSVNPEETETFILFEGKYLSDCAMRQFDKLDIVNVIPQANIHLFRSQDSNIYICTIKDYNLTLSTTIVNRLQPYLSASLNVITVQTKALAEYQAAEPMNQTCIIRMVRTSKLVATSLDPHFVKLEQPNIVTGISAGVISLLEHSGQAGTAIVCYTEYTEDLQVAELKHFFGNLSVSQSSSSRTTILDSNLYT